MENPIKTVGPNQKKTYLKDNGALLPLTIIYACAQHFYFLLCK